MGKAAQKLVNRLCADVCLPHTNLIVAEKFTKPFTIKPEAGLPERIEKFIDGLPGDKPANAKALFKALLDYAETHVSTEAYEQQNESLQQELDAAKAEIEVLQGKLSVFEDSAEVNTTETTRLQTENMALTEKVNEFIAILTPINEAVKGLQQKLPEVFREEDNSPAQSLERIVFLVGELKTQVTEAQTRAESLETELHSEKTKPAKLAPGQAIVSFPPKQLEELRMARMVFEKLGHKFKTQNAEEVIHLAVSEYNNTCRQMVGFCRDFEPLLTILNPT